MVSILTNPLPYTVFISGSEIPIKWDHVTALKFNEIIEDEILGEKEKIFKSVELYFDSSDTVKFDIKDLISAILVIYSANSEENESKANKSTGRNKKVLSYSKDANYIYSAFYEKYGIDLSETKIHWWKFKALLDGLSEDTQIKKIINIRALDTAKMDSEQKKHYRKLKDIYKLEDNSISKEEQEQLDKIEEALASGEDVSIFF